MSSYFEKAKPVWPAEMEKEKHVCVDFRCIANLKKEAARVRISSSGIYNLFVNGVFAAYGPARAGRNHFRMDEIDIGNLVREGNNIIVIEAVGYYVNSYCMIKQPSFLQAEVVQSGEVVCFTGSPLFEARINPNSLRKVQRFSFQRPMVEAYHLEEDWDSYRQTESPFSNPVKLHIQEDKIIIPRRAPYPQYEKLYAKVISSGSAERTDTPEDIYRDRSLVRISPLLQGFSQNELDCCVTDEIQSVKFSFNKTKSQEDVLEDGEFLMYEFPHNASGMLAFTVHCEQDTEFFCVFDEVILDGDISIPRSGCANTVKYTMKKGTYHLKFFEVYTMKYLKMVAFGGKFHLEDVHMVEYKHPPVEYRLPIAEHDEKLRKIFDAALETYRQNAVDIFMDCPSRERAGWLCDSFFTGRVERLLTGDNKIEQSFLENFLHEDSYEFLPEGMLPMCYPADHTDFNFIVNWAMWLILELEEYTKRSNDHTMVLQFREKLYRLMDYLSGLTNEDGLLEKVPGWVFVEWSKANELVQDVNYPSNMLYSAALRSMGRLYHDDELAKQSEKVKETVLRQSFRNGFFTDNAVRRDGVLVNTGESTEVCQYYAFFFDIVTPETCSELFQILLRDFGPNRKLNNDKYERIYPANAFIGNYLRLEVMMRYGYWREVLENIRGYFAHMAEQTGTLWENMSDTASCDHGFASHVIYWLAAMPYEGQEK